MALSSFTASSPTPNAGAPARGGSGISSKEAGGSWSSPPGSSSFPSHATAVIARLSVSRRADTRWIWNAVLVRIAFVIVRATSLVASSGYSGFECGCDGWSRSLGCRPGVAGRGSLARRRGRSDRPVPAPRFGAAGWPVRAPLGGYAIQRPTNSLRGCSRSARSEMPWLARARCYGVGAITPDIVTVPRETTEGATDEWGRAHQRDGPRRDQQVIQAGSWKGQARDSSPLHRK